MIKRVQLNVKSIFFWRLEETQKYRLKFTKVKVCVDVYTFSCIVSAPAINSSQKGYSNVDGWQKEVNSSILGNNNRK